MAPWSVPSWAAAEGGSQEELPDSLEPNRPGIDTAFEVFIDGALTTIYNEASGRSKEQRAIRECCKRVLGMCVCRNDR